MEENRINEFVARFEELVSKNQTDDALVEILDPQNEEILRQASLDLLIPVGNRLSDGRLFRNDVEAWCTYQSILDYMVKISKPKEILLGLLELLEQAQSDEFFDLIIRPLKVTFLRLPSKNVDSLLWGLHGLYKYVSKIDLDDYDYLSDDQGGKILLENCPKLNRADMCVTSALNFIEPFVSEAKQCKLLIESIDQRNRQVLALASFVLKLIEKPISFYDISSKECKSNRDRYQTAQRSIMMLFDLTPNVYWKVIEWQQSNKLSISCKYLDDHSEIENACVKPVAVGALASFVYCYGFCKHQLPLVYSLEYQFESILPYVICLLKEVTPDNSQCYVHHALKLCKYFLNLYHDTLWSVARLNDHCYQDLILGLVSVVTYSKVKKYRQRSFRLFNDVLGLLPVEGKLAVIRMIFYFVGEDSEGANRWCIAGNGIRGYMIDYYRNQLTNEINSGAPPLVASTACTFQSSLPSMLALFTVLKHREQTDLLEYFDQYMAVLNLLRYLCITIAAGRLTVHVGLLQNVREKFLDVLLQAVELSKGHYELDLKSVVRENKIYDEEEVNVLQQAGNSFDMIKSLICRVNELMQPCLDEEK